MVLHGLQLLFFVLLNIILQRAGDIMRDILFRGKCIRNGEWVYGFLDGFKMKVGDDYKNIPFEFELIGPAFDNTEE